MRHIVVAAIAGLALVGHNLPSGAGDKVITPFNGKDLKGWKLKDELIARTKRAV